MVFAIENLCLWIVRMCVLIIPELLGEYALFITVFILHNHELSIHTLTFGVAKNLHSLLLLFPDFQILFLFV